MYLLDEIKDKENHSYEMVGALKGSAFWTNRLIRFGYVTLSDESGMHMKGHEFHYYDTDNNGVGCVAKKPTGNRSWQCIHKKNGGYMGFPHLYYPSNCEFVFGFIKEMENYKKQ